jgi:hypothetical protein
MRGLVNVRPPLDGAGSNWPAPTTPHEIIADYFRNWGKSLASKTADDLIIALSDHLREQKSGKS